MSDSDMTSRVSGKSGNPELESGTGTGTETRTEIGTGIGKETDINGM